MWFAWGLIGLILWVAIAFCPARVAARKGHSFIGYFLLSLLFFPLSLIMAYAVATAGQGYTYLRLEPMTKLAAPVLESLSTQERSAEFEPK